MLPVLPEKIGSLRDFWDDASEKFGSETDGHFKLFGVRNVIVFLETIKGKGDYIVTFMRSTDSLDQTIKGLFGSDVPCSKYFDERFKDFTGIYLSHAENVPKLELLMDWQETHEFLEERNMLEMPWCVTAPLLPGKAEEVVKYSKEAATRRDEWVKVLRDHDVVRNLTFLQRTPHGDFVVKYTVTSSPLDKLMEKFLACDQEVCKVARQFAKDVTGIDFSDPQNMPDLRLLFKWDEQRGFDTAEQVIAYSE
jgi:hypothetical protein